MRTAPAPPATRIRSSSRVFGRSGPQLERRSGVGAPGVFTGVAKCGFLYAFLHAGLMALSVSEIQAAPQQVRGTDVSGASFTEFSAAKRHKKQVRKQQL